MIFIVGIPVMCLLIYTGFVIINGWVFANIKEPKAVLVKEIPFISVIIPARNEEKSIASCLKSVLNQSWPVDRFEVILINDHSTDATREIALMLAEEYPNLIVLY
ncbi:MAG: glycosyltransferase, partial [Bacteroidetes bacterium]|nr:glycosyltransferase [Bacteroidota bacterium]